MVNRNSTGVITFGQQVIGRVDLDDCSFNRIRDAIEKRRQAEAIRLAQREKFIRQRLKGIHPAMRPFAAIAFRTVSALSEI